MSAITTIEDRWKRRSAWRKLAGRIAAVSVSIFPKRGFEPTRVADQELKRWFLREEYYDSNRGLLLPDDSDEGGILQF